MSSHLGDVGGYVMCGLGLFWAEKTTKESDLIWVFLLLCGEYLGVKGLQDGEDEVGSSLSFDLQVSDTDLLCCDF